jgi:ABC-2 type transport system ATP-binding protein
LLSSSDFAGIELKNLSFFYENRLIFSQLNQIFPSGKLHLLSGNNGVGKTTLFRLMSGLIYPQEGGVFFYPEKEQNSFLALGANVGFYQDLSLRENLLYLKFLYQKQSDPFLSLNFWGLTDYKHQLFSKLSLGEKMRAILAGIFFVRPKFLLLDEPEIGLDQQGRLLFQKALNHLVSEGSCVLVITHHLAEWKQPFCHHHLKSKS